MKQDVLDALSGRFPNKIPSKETLNHPGIIDLVTGFNVFDDTPQAYDIAWRKLGIDIHSALPGGNAELVPWTMPFVGVLLSVRRLTTCAAAWTPASVRPAATTTARQQSGTESASSRTCCTDTAPFWRCQPA